LLESIWNIGHSATVRHCKNIWYTRIYISITDQGIELLLETENAKSSGAVAAAESSSDDQAYDSRWFWSSVTKPVHENVSIANIMSLGQHFITLTLKVETVGQDAHATIHIVTYARAIIVLWRRYIVSELKTITDHVWPVDFDQFRARVLLPLHHNF